MRLSSANTNTLSGIITSIAIAKCCGGERPRDDRHGQHGGLKQRRDQHGCERLADDGGGGRDGQALEDRQPIEIAAEVEAQRRRQQQERVERQRGRGGQERDVRVGNDEQRAAGQDRGGDHRREQAAPVTAGADQLPPGERAGAAATRDATAADANSALRDGAPSSTFGTVRLRLG